MGAIVILNGFRPTNHRDNSPQVQPNVAGGSGGQKLLLRLAASLICGKMRKVLLNMLSKRLHLLTSLGLKWPVFCKRHQV